jgi:hypothetical protein
MTKARNTFFCVVGVSGSIFNIHLFVFQVDFSEKPSFWKALKPPAKDKCGELLTSLCYHPSNSILTLTLLKARNLKAKDINGKSGNFSLAPCEMRAGSHAPCFFSLQILM